MRPPARPDPGEGRRQDEAGARRKGRGGPARRPKEKDDDPNKPAGRRLPARRRASRRRRPRSSSTSKASTSGSTTSRSPTRPKRACSGRPTRRSWRSRRSIEGKPGVYTIELLDDPKPKPLTTPGDPPGALASRPATRIVGLVDGVPASLVAAAPLHPPARARSRSIASGPCRRCACPSGSAPPSTSAGGPCATATTTNSLGNRNWDAVRRKYSDMAAQSPDLDTFAIVVDLMLGELNGSHLGFTPQREHRPRAPGPSAAAAARDPSRGGDAPGRWNEVTAHLGVRFESGLQGAGLEGPRRHPRRSRRPARRAGSLPGEVILDHRRRRASIRRWT